MKTKKIKSVNITLILSVGIACAIVAGAIIFVMLRQQAATNPGASLTTVTEELDVPALLQSCAPGDSCIVIDRTCSFCCKYTAINAKHETLFNEMFSDSCGTYAGKSCNCFDLSSYPACVNGKCQLVKFDDEKKPPAK